MYRIKGKYFDGNCTGIHISERGLLGLFIHSRTIRENTMSQNPEQLTTINIFIPSIQPAIQITLNIRFVTIERVPSSTKKAEDPIAGDQIKCCERTKENERERRRKLRRDEYITI